MPRRKNSSLASSIDVMAEPEVLAVRRGIAPAVKPTVLTVMLSLIYSSKSAVVVNSVPEALAPLRASGSQTPILIGFCVALEKVAST